MTKLQTFTLSKHKAQIFLYLRTHVLKLCVRRWTIILEIVCKLNDSTNYLQGLTELLDFDTITPVKIQANEPIHKRTQYKS